MVMRMPGSHEVMRVIAVAVRQAVQDMMVVIPSLSLVLGRNSARLKLDVGW